MKKYITEFIGTFFLVLVIGLSAFVGSGVPAPLAIGAVLMVMVYAGGQISGAHYNPAVTVAVWVRGRISSADAVSYIIAQLLGAVVAAFLVKYLVDKNLFPQEALKNSVPIKAVVAELLGTFALAYVVLNVATSKATAGNSYFGLAIGFTVMAMAFALGKFSGGAFNPAVAIAICFLKLANWADIWIYLVGCLG